MCRVLFLSILGLVPLSSAMVLSEKAQIARSRLVESLSSPSGKLTLNPEIVIPEPSDPTAILLQATGITSMSEKLRIQAKANTAWISGSITSLTTFCNEQEQSRGDFPGPIPVVYCDSPENVQEVADAGADGLLVPVFDGKEIKSLKELSQDDNWVKTCESALDCGMQPIPEVTVNSATAAAWDETDMEKLVESIGELAGSEPATLLLSVNPVDDEQEEVCLPLVPKSLGKRVPILGSVRAAAGENRMGEEISRFKAAGFTGAVLRSECVPGFRMNLDLEYVARFWGACIADLKSTKSKTFNFRSRNLMEKSVPLEWAKYQKDVMDSGALGEMEDNMPTGINPDAGDYVGF